MKPLIIANWKCNPESLEKAKRNFEIIKRGVRNVENAKVVICAPYIFLSGLKPDKYIKLGAQDCSSKNCGPFTGEISPEQLKNSEVEYVILGHSERRNCLGESAKMVNQKLKAALAAGLKVILCIGSENENPGEEMAVQMEDVLLGIEDEDFLKIIFTYEPVWAISTTKNRIIATPEQAANGSAYMKNILEKIAGKKIAQDAIIIYGGSVDSKNIKGFLTEGKMTGGLVGAASLDPEEFLRIIKIA